MKRTPLAPTFHQGPTRSFRRTRKGLDAPLMLTPSSYLVTETLMCFGRRDKTTVPD
jgi:hypothetical protein